MTEDIITHLEDVLSSLEDIKQELEVEVNDPKITPEFIAEIETGVYEPLIESIQSLSDILDSFRKMDDVDAFYDPYNEGIE